MMPRMYVRGEYAQIASGGLMARKSSNTNSAAEIVAALPEPAEHEYNFMTDEVFEQILRDTDQKILSGGKVLASFDW